MQPAPKVVACYLRVSTASQNEAGQRAEIEKWLAGNSVDPKLVRWFVDKKSGDHLARPAFNAMQEAIFKGEVGTICVYKLDRISRKLLHGLNILAEWCEKGLRVVSVTQLLDWNGALGHMLASIFFAVAQMEQELRRERQKAGIAEAKKAGVYKGRKSGTTKAKPKRAITLRKKGNTVAEIGRALGVSRMTVFRYLRTAQS